MKFHYLYRIGLFILLLLISFVCACGDNGSGVEKIELGYPGDGEVVSADLISSFVTMDWLDGSTDDIGDIILILYDLDKTIPLNLDRVDNSRVYFGLDLRGLPDDAYLAEIRVLAGDKVVASTDPFSLDVNSVEVRKKAIEFMWQNDTVNFGRVKRWENIPIEVELSSDFPSEESNNVQEALDFWYKYTDINFSLYWGDNAVIGCGNDAADVAWSKRGRIYIQPYSLCGHENAAGAAFAPFNDNGVNTQCIIGINPELLNQQYVLTMVYAHELGHCLDLTHYEISEIPFSLMSVSGYSMIIPVEMSTALKMWYQEMQPGDPFPAL